MINTPDLSPAFVMQFVYPAPLLELIKYSHLLEEIMLLISPTPLFGYFPSLFTLLSALSIQDSTVLSL